MFTIKIIVDRDIAFCKKMYNLYHGYPLNQKVLKKDLSIWFSCLIEGDVDSQSISDDTEEDEENE